MSALLFDESPLCVQPTLAKAIGLNEAIILQQMHYWIRSGKSGKEIDGVRWIYNSLSDWHDTFPFWSESTIYRALQSLEDKKLIKTGKFNRRKGDRTKWFTIAYDELKYIELMGGRNSIFQNETASSQNETASSQNETTLPETSSEISSENTTISPQETETPRPVDLSPKREYPERDKEEFSAVFSDIEVAMGQMTVRDCETVRELWLERPLLEAHLYAFAQTKKYADGFNLIYYEKCLRGYSGSTKQNAVIAAAAQFV